MTEALSAGVATSVGSLPHHDPVDAARFVLAHHAALPAVPELPNRSPAHGMVAAGLCGVPGVTVRPDGGLDVDLDALDPDGPVDVAAGAGVDDALTAFLTAAAGRTAPVKVQLAGPVTLGLGLLDAGVPPEIAFDVAAAAVRARARHLAATVAAALPGAPVLAVLDEPGMVTVGTARLPLDAEAVADLLSGALAAVEPLATTGVHCCGATDWRVLAQAGPQLLSVPAVPSVVDGAGVIAPFLEHGGWVAWGAVPTSGPVGGGADHLWRRLSALWCELVRAGCDPILLREQALVTPACGLAGHGPGQAAQALDLATDLAGRVGDQAVGARLSIGA